MKFGKALRREKVPEWTEAYVDYKSLKKALNEIKRSKSRHVSGNGIDPEDQTAVGFDPPRRGGERRFFLPNFLEESEVEMSFFEKLDGELGKATEFYRDRVDEVAGEACELSRQVEALAALRKKRDSGDAPTSEVLERVEITAAVRSGPVSAIRGAFGDSEEEELKKAEERLRAVFIEFYHKLHILRKFRLINQSFN